MSTTLATLLQASLRIAGITWMPGTIPSTDQYGELIPALNDMLASYSLDGHRIYTSSIATFALTAGQKVYTIGPGAELDTPRPLFIKEANLIYPTTPTVRQGISILDDDQWAAISVQDIDGAPSWALYYDGGMDSAGRGNVYLYFQPPAGYTLELYTWLQLKSDFTAVTDAVILPPGYNEMIRWNFGLRVAGLYPLEAKLSPVAADMAAKSLHNVITLNSSSPKIGTEAGLGGGDDYFGRGWLDGPFRGHA